MRLTWLELRNVRCYEAIRFTPEAGANVLIGDNGSGKTTLLEAIGYLATLRSFRRAPDASMVRAGAEGAVVRGEFLRGQSPVRIEVEIPAEGRRRVLLNGKRPQGRAALIAEVPLVAFLPDDLDLVKRGPSLRREFLDDTAAGLRPAAAGDQDGYERALRQRNTLLRHAGRSADPVTLDVWDERLAVLGSGVIAARLDVLSAVMPALSSVVEDLGGGSAAIAHHYEGAGLGRVEPGTDRHAIENRLGAALAAARGVDVERRTTTVGPHRDEVVFTMDGRDVRTRASQGEQRSVALGLRVAAFEALAGRGEIPVLLLDDVFSELDQGRSDRLVQRLPNGQVFITSARDDEVPVVGARWRVGASGVEAGP
jgi:DNA replication and repair protein RecF